MRIPKPIVAALLELDAVLLGGTVRRAVRNYGDTAPDRRAEGEMGLEELPRVVAGADPPSGDLPETMRDAEVHRRDHRSVGNHMAQERPRPGTRRYPHYRARGRALRSRAVPGRGGYEYFQFANLPQREVYRSYFRDFVLRRAYFIRKNLDGTMLGLCDLVPRRVVKAALDGLEERLDEARRLEEIQRCFGDFYLWLFNAHARLVAGGRPWISKEPPYGRNADQLFRMIPHGRLVVLVRDGRDVALSMHERAWHPTVRHAMDRWRHFAEMTVRALERCPDDRYLVVRYRDLVLNFRSCTRAITEFLELPNLDVSTVEERDLMADDTNLERWKYELPSNDREYFASTCGRVMKRFELPL